MDFFQPILITFNYLINFCRFLGCKSSTNGGAILLNIQNLDLFVNYCLFESCSSTLFGGSIYLINRTNNISLSFNCFYNSSSPYYSVIYSYSRYHSLTYSSFLLCPSKINICLNVVVGIYLGIQYLNNLNSTLTNANHHSGIHQNNPIITNTKFINFISQKSCDFFTGFNFVSYNPITSYLNIINNEGKIALFCLSNLNIGIYQNIIFKNNSGTLTSIDSRFIGNLELINSYFDKNIYSKGLYNLITSNIFQNYYINNYNFYNLNTYLCLNKINNSLKFFKYFPLKLLIYLNFFFN